MYQSADTGHYGHIFMSSGLEGLLLVLAVGKLVCCVTPSVVTDSLQLHGLQPSRLLCPWGFSRQEYWSRLPCPPSGNLPNPGIEPWVSPIAGGILGTHVSFVDFLCGPRIHFILFYFIFLSFLFFNFILFLNLTKLY